MALNENFLIFFFSPGLWVGSGGTNKNSDTEWHKTKCQGVSCKREFYTWYSQLRCRAELKAMDKGDIVYYGNLMKHLHVAGM